MQLVVTNTDYGFDIMVPSESERLLSLGNGVVDIADDIRKLFGLHFLHIDFYSLNGSVTN